MRVHGTLFILTCLLLANVQYVAHAGGKTPVRALLRTLSPRIQAKDTKDINIDLGDTHVTVALDNNLPIPNGPSVIKTLASELKKHPDAHCFSMQWGLWGPTSQTYYGVRYDRQKRHLSFLSCGTLTSGGKCLDDYFWYTHVSDKNLLRIAARKKLPAFVLEHLDNVERQCGFEGDPEFLPWFNELKRQGCPRRKLKFSIQAMNRIRVSDTLH